MKAIGYFHSLPITDPQALVALDLPDPSPQGRDLLVQVEAISVNPVDYKIRQFRTPPAGEAGILGWDAAGVVVATGPEATLFRPGDTVFYAGALNRPGANSQLHLVDERLVGRKPASLDFAAAAALPLTSITAWELLFDRLGVVPGKSGPRQTLLVVGAAGGVGSILLQLAARLTPLTLIATASRPETTAWVQALGAHHVIDHSQPMPAQLAALGLEGVDMVISLTNTEAHYPALIEMLRPQGKLALIDDPATLDAKPLKLKSLSLHWELMFTRSLFQTPDMIAQHHLLNEVAALIDAGVLRTTLDQVLGPITPQTLQQAHAVLESGKAIGKLVLAGW